MEIISQFAIIRVSHLKPVLRYIAMIDPGPGMVKEGTRGRRGGGGGGERNMFFMSIYSDDYSDTDKRY